MGESAYEKPKARILVVEDDAALLGGLLDVLVFNGYDAKGLEDGGHGLRTGLEEQFDLILLDVMLPTRDGFSICKEIRDKKPAQGIIIITAKGAEDDIVTGFKSGADDYIPKPFSLREVMVRVEAVLRRTGKNLGDEQVDYMGIFFDAKNLRARCRDRSVELTRREMDIIIYLHRNLDRIVSKKKPSHRGVAVCRRGHRNPDGRYSHAEAAQENSRSDRRHAPDRNRQGGGVSAFAGVTSCGIRVTSCGLRVASCRITVQSAWSRAHGTWSRFQVSGFSLDRNPSL